ncbi:putative opsin Rh5-like [Apostichopus japonicus]|uniref:Putative opsin Rh5-like n=1 Tax=Stichopus japonicus TaxID=307972 RepID=A0A2G8JU09_STIJA|nr:putative opsin Rh5-like [Apostichopus japonicus]
MFINATDLIPLEVSPLTNIERIILAVLCAVVAVCGILGNGLVILAVWFSRRLRTATNVYVVNLSLADIVTCLSVPIYVMALMSWETWPGSELPCTLVAALSMICVGCSQFTLAGIALNRYVLVTKARDVYTSLYCRRNLVISTICTWLIPILAVTLPSCLELVTWALTPSILVADQNIRNHIHTTLSWPSYCTHCRLARSSYVTLKYSFSLNAIVKTWRRQLPNIQLHPWQ